jgi:hypothetical protein
MKMLALKKKSTPRYYFFKKKKNNYINFRYNILQIGYKKLPNFIIKKYKLKFKKKTKYFKRRHFKSIKIYGKLKNKVFNRYIKD